MSNNTTDPRAPYSIVFYVPDATQDVDGTAYATLDDAEEALDARRENDSDPTLRIVDCDGETCWPVGYHVQAGTTTSDYDHGEIVEVDGDRVRIAWAGSGESTWAAADMIEPHNPDKEALAAELRGDKDIVLTPEMLERWAETGSWEASS